MKIEILCDQCKAPFLGDERLAELPKGFEVLCPNCLDGKEISIG